jgi:hypothetical protein
MYAWTLNLCDLISPVFFADLFLIIPLKLLPLCNTAMLCGKPGEFHFSVEDLILALHKLGQLDSCIVDLAERIHKSFVPSLLGEMFKLSISARNEATLSKKLQAGPVACSSKDGKGERSLPQCFLYFFFAELRRAQYFRVSMVNH